MTHVFLLVHPRADYAGFYCAASVLLRTRFLVWAVSNLGEVVHGPNRSATQMSHNNVLLLPFHFYLGKVQAPEEKIHGNC